MNTPKILVTLIGIGAAALVGCASEASDEHAQGADAISGAGLSATITTREISNVPDGEKASVAPGCHVNLKRPVVDVRGETSVTRAITNALDVPASPEQVCKAWVEDSEDADWFVNIEGDYHVMVNEAGLLSLSVAELSYSKGAAHPNTSELHFAFDLNTGGKLMLADILEPSALTRVTTDCVEGGSFDAETDAEKLSVCSTLFLVEREGIRTFSTPDFRFDPEGTLQPWSEIEDDLEPGVVRDFYESR